MAPEVFPIANQTHYDLSVDIWSLGTIVLEWIYEMSEPNETPKGPWPKAKWQHLATGWHKQLLSHLNEQDDDDVVIDIVNGMMHIEPTKRASAAKCLTNGFENRLWERRDCDNLVTQRPREEEEEEGKQGKDADRRVDTAAGTNYHRPRCHYSP
ncbi:hypothetical protein F4679DRAFT_97537 [Xylaria curta]|nr:hypothetical protein F4679DRAFT_97537 [Xylaria curta]